MKNNNFKIFNQKSIDVLNDVLKRKNYNTWVLHTGPKWNTFILRKQYGRKSWTNVIRVSYKHDLGEDLETALDVVLDKHCNENLWG